MRHLGPTACIATGGRRARARRSPNGCWLRWRPTADLITVLDGHPATLSWLGGVGGRRVRPLGVDHFGQSGDIPDLYRAYGIDADAIVEAAARACVDRVRR